MADASLPPLTARALDRLHKLIDGNGDPKEAVRLLGTDEKTWTLNGVMKLEPIAEAHAQRYPGGGRGKAQVMANVGALHAEIERRKKAFTENPSWIPATLKQLKEQNAEGWGMDDVRITLPEQSAVLAASEMCPTCRGQQMLTCQGCAGQGTIMCNHCAGSRQEFCYNCAGHGTNPTNSSQPCNICNGRRYIPCRFCHASGQIACPACHGKRGTTCAACNGSGSVTEEITLSCGARTHFQITDSGELPSGLRRGLSRLGIVNLPNGYADIMTVDAPVQKDDDSLHKPPPGMDPNFDRDDEKKPVPEIHYRATLPYADIRISFGGKATLVSSFGKRGSLIGVPAFLDTALIPARQKLQLAAQGGNHFHEATGTRLMRDALALQLTGNNKVNDLRRRYPLGLTAETAAEILANMRRALNRQTKRRRVITAVICMILSAGVFGGLFMTNMHAQLTQTLAPKIQLDADLGLLVMVLVFSWLLLSSSTAMALRKRFPGKIALLQSTGNTGYVMSVVIIALFAAAIVLTPIKPAWVALLH